ncbi:MAG: L,D-transpeptidase family protein [Roseomonas sp.]|nr:L,D-transpeptidase family protein [Roseomonas sp.]
MQAAARVGADGLLRFQGAIYRCAIGKGGIRADKREGDGATPAGFLPLRRVFYRADRLAPPRATAPVAPVAPDDGWCDDPAHPDYNTQIRLPHPARHEELWRADAIYDVIGVLGWNDAPITRGRGSAIFLHLARPGFTPTEGCIALEQRDLLRVLAEGLTAMEVMG